MNKKILAKFIRKKRVRAKVFGTQKCPRLSVFRSCKHISGQLINDQAGKTLVSFSDLNLKEPKIKGLVTRGKMVGEGLAKKAKLKKIEKVVFDRGGYKYHGAIKALADGARARGLKI